MNSKTILFGLISVLLAISQLCAQTPTIVWEKALGGSDGDNAVGAVVTSDGNCITLGKVLSINGDFVSNTSPYYYKSWVVKSDPNGTIIWKLNLGYGEFASIAATSDAGCVVTDGGRQVTRISSNGGILWQKTFLPPNTSYPSSGNLMGATLAADGDIVIAGSAGNDNTSANEVWVIKIAAATGSLLWQRTYGSALYNTVTGPIQYVIVNADGSYAVGIRFYMAVFNSNGSLAWEKKFSTITNTWAAYNGKIIPVATGGYIIVGSVAVSGNNAASDALVLKTTSAGDVIWQKTLGGTAYDIFVNATPTSDGGCVAVGIGNSTDGDLAGNNGKTGGWVVKLNSSGTVDWQRIYGSTSPFRSTIPNAIASLSNSSFFLAGTLNTNPNYTSTADWWLARLDVQTPVVTIYTLKTGAWNDLTVWSCNCIPAITDNVQLKHIISIPGSYTANALKVSFDAGVKLQYGSNAKLKINQ